MSYSDRSSSGGVAGVAGVFGTILLVVLGVGLKVAARAARNSARNSYNNNNYNYGSPPSNLPLSRDDARQTSIDTPPAPVPSPAPVDDNWLAEQQRLQREQAEQAARQQREWQQQQEANRLQQAQQAEADRQRRESELAQQEQQRVAQRQAEQEQRDRDRAAMEAARNPQPAAQQPIAQQPGAPAANPDVPPGFAVTALDQVKPKSEIFARAEDGWYPAVVTRRVGAEVTVRFTTNGVVGRVALNRIRLQNDPASAVANEGRPGALRPVVAQRDPANKAEPEDDAAFVAKPRKEPEQGAEPAAVTAPAATPAPTGAPALRRIWTNDTGEFKVDAELVSFEFDLVQLKKADGKVISIRIEKLSADDQAIVREKFP